MDFFLPKAERKGRGVITWNADHPDFISHGPSTGGLVIGQPSGELKLYGMSPKDVVQLVPCRVSNSVVLDAQDVARLAECINWAIDEGGPSSVLIKPE